jgi:hypothetical protein
MTGTVFEPNGKLTRAMMVTVLHRMAGSPDVEIPSDGGRLPFTDVNKSHVWCKEAIEWAYVNGIVNGTSATTYAPDNNVTVQDMAVILHRYYQNYLGKTPVKGSLDGVADASAIAGYAKDALAWAYSLKLVEAKNGKLNPTSQATRAQVAKALVTLADVK